MPVIHRQTGRMPTRRAVLLGGAGVATAGVLGAGAVYEGVLPGRPQLQARLGLNGDVGTVPDVQPADVQTGSFVSERRGGVDTGYRIITSVGAWRGPVPRCRSSWLSTGAAATAGRWSARTSTSRSSSRPTSRGGAPFAIATVDGGTSYWHERPDGEDAGAMVVDEFLPLLAEHGLPATPATGSACSGGRWAGTAHCGSAVSSDRIVWPPSARVSPAMWSDPQDASRSGFDDAAEYDAFTVQGHQDDLAGIPVRIDCGTGDQFYRAVQDYAEAFPDDADVSATFEPGAHDPDYWRRVLPAQLDFLGRHLTAPE